MGFSEQRRTKRFEVEQEIRVRRGEDEFVGMTDNFSLGGVCLRLGVSPPFRTGDRLRVSFRIPSLDQPLSADAVVRWRNAADPSIIGVQFVTGFRAKETYALGRYLEGLEAKKAEP
jgi:hypothetical protein